MKRSMTLYLGALVIVTLANLAQAKTVINVDFAPTISDPAGSPNIFTVDYVGTAAAPDTGTVWNHVLANTPSPAAFIGSPGYFDFLGGPSTDSTITNSFGTAMPGMSVTINSGLGAFGSGNNSPTDGEAGAGLDYVSVQAQGLMRDYLIANGANPGSVTISGLTPGKVIDIYAYGEGDNGSNDRQTKFTANGVVNSTAGFAGLPHNNLLMGSDYVVLPGVVVDGSGNIQIAYEVNNSQEAPFNGFQLVYDILAGDANDDNFVNMADYQLIRSNFRLTGATRAQGDVTGPLGGNAGDGVVDFYDFAMWQANFPGPLTGQIAIPEPGSLALCLTVLGTISSVRRRR